MTIKRVALVLRFHFTFSLQHLLKDATESNLPIEAFLDSRTVFDAIAKSRRKTERSFQISIATQRESYKNIKLARLGWMPGNTNPADALTKEQLRDAHPLAWVCIA